MGLQECKYTQIDREMLDYVNHSMKNLLKGDWTLVRECKEQKVYYRQEPSSNSLTCYAESLIRVPYLEALSMVGEVEGLSELISCGTEASLILALTQSRAMYRRI